MQEDVLFEMKSRAKTRKDGVYSYRAQKYCVKNNRVIFVVDKLCIYQVMGHFLTPVSKIFDYQFQAENYLKEQVKLK